MVIEWFPYHSEGRDCRREWFADRRNFFFLAVQMLEKEGVQVVLMRRGGTGRPLKDGSQAFRL